MKVSEQIEALTNEIQRNRYTLELKASHQNKKRIRKSIAIKSHALKSLETKNRNS